MDKFLLKRKRITSGEDQDQSNSVKFAREKCSWNHFELKGLNLSYCKLLTKEKADELFLLCELNINYIPNEKLKVYGKWHNIPRKHVAFGDVGLSYQFSGTTLKTAPWPAFLKQCKEELENVCHCTFNFVLINRYKDGQDYIAEHRDNEKEIVFGSTIASLSLGEERNFMFRHKDSLKKVQSSEPKLLKFQLEHGSVLLMHYPTNEHWYHSLPKQKLASKVRINLTFRKMNSTRTPDVPDFDISNC